MSFTSRASSFLSLLALLFAFILSIHADLNTPAPECAANCMKVKMSEAANWFGPGDIATYCSHPEFLKAYNNCTEYHCSDTDAPAGKQAGLNACKTSLASTNRTGLPGPANSPADLPTNSSAANSGNHSLAAGATPSTTTPASTSSINGTSSAPPTRFSSAVSSAASQAAASAANSITPSSSSSLLITLASALLIMLVSHQA